MLVNPIVEEDRSSFRVKRSFSGRRWALRAADVTAERALQDAGRLSPALAHLLALRGVTVDGLEDLLHPTLKRLLPEPRALRDMDTAVDRVLAAIRAGERLAVFGDYDVDGSCSAALFTQFMSALGIEPLVYIPDRMREGYGPNAPALLGLKEQGVSLVVTVDCGATAVGPLTAAREAGLDVVVLDHHAVEALPPAVAQVNPNQPGDDSGLGYLCAAGVTFLFLVALNRALRDSGWYAARGLAEPDLMAMLDLVGLATVCDVVPLVGVNRAFVRAGLAQLSVQRRPGLAALCEVARAAAPFTPYTLGFVLGPRINAGGRVGVCDLGHRLVTATTRETALPLAASLDRHNRERQAIEGVILEEAMAMAALQANQPFILVAEEGWHAGVVGIVAGRLKDRYGKPALVVGFEGGEGRGSARSIPGIDLGAVIRAARAAHLIGTGGGHAMAAGFSLSATQLEGLRDFLARELTGSTVALEAAQALELDVLVSAGACSEALAADFARIGPFGAGNPEPLLAVSDVLLSYADQVGENHLRLRLTGGDGTVLNAIAFRALGTPLGEGLMKARGQRVHLAGRLRAEVWNGRTRVQLHVEDAAPAGR